MKRYRLKDLSDVRSGHFLQKVMPGRYLYNCGVGFKKPGEKSHPEAESRHDDHEAFVILQGKGEIEINGKRQPVTTGDVIVVEPGEDHHLIGDVQDPCVNMWLHACPERPLPK